MTIDELKQHQCAPHTELVMEIQRLKERLESAEEALKFYADFEKSKCVCPSNSPTISFVAKTNEARAHFSKFGEGEK